MSSHRSLLGLGLLALGCGQEPEREGRSLQGVIVGEDDRLDAYQVPSVSRPVVVATAALMYAHRVTFPDSTAVELKALSAAEALDLCPEEPFRAQPVAAYCSGVLIDDTLLATAGHCLGEDLDQASQRCERIQIVFGFEVGDEGASTVLAANDVFSCRRVVLLERDPGDLAVVELDRPVQGREPARLSEARPAGGDRLIVASHGAGLPLKLELAAEVVDAPDGSEFFVAATDTFGGGSGGGLFNQQLELAGMVLRGRADWELVAGCRRAARVSLAEEEHGYTTPQISLGLAALDWPSPRLFGSEHRCGDGVCGSSESNASCADDCTPALCGDHICELDERQNCVEDCHRYDAVPEHWTGDPELGLLANEPPAAAPDGSGCAIGSQGNMSRPQSSAGAALALLVLALRRRGGAPQYRSAARRNPSAAFRWYPNR